MLLLSGLYNYLCGCNPYTGVILKMIGLNYTVIERFRDCGVDIEKGQIWVYARTGGQNREQYKNEKLIYNTWYIEDHDDTYDETYAEYNFRIPEPYIKCDLSNYARERVDWVKIFQSRGINPFPDKEIDPHKD